MIVELNRVVLLTSVDIDFNGMDGKGIGFFHDDFLFLLSISGKFWLSSHL
jgi:hypothetical protein